MKTRNAFVKLMICVLLVLTTTFFVNPHQAKAEPVTDCRKIVTGTYLTTTRSDEFGSFRGILTYTQDGNVFFSASNQGGSSSNPSYGIIQGSWICTSSREIASTVLNFNYPAGELPGSIARSDTRVTFDPKAQTVQGTTTFRVFSLNADPLNDNDPVRTGTFTFTGQRVKPSLNED